MAWTTPLTAVANAAFTAAQFNASVRDNLLETGPAKATTAGSIFAATGTNAIGERIPTGATVATAQSTSTTASYGDLTTVGPTLSSLTTGTKSILFLAAQIENSTAGAGGYMGFNVSGASTIAASDDRSLRVISGSAGERNRVSCVVFQTGLTGGSNTFTAKYTTPTGGTATFQYREMSVIPL